LFTCRRDGVFQLVLVDSPPIGPNRLQELLNRQIEASGLGFAPRLTERPAAEARQVVLEGRVGSLAHQARVVDLNIVLRDSFLLGRLANAILGNRRLDGARVELGRFPRFAQLLQLGEESLVLGSIEEGSNLLNRSLQTRLALSSGPKQVLLFGEAGAILGELAPHFVIALPGRVEGKPGLPVEGERLPTPGQVAPDPLEHVSRSNLL